MHKEQIWDLQILLQAVGFRRMVQPRMFNRHQEVCLRFATAFDNDIVDFLCIGLYIGYLIVVGTSDASSTGAAVKTADTSVQKSTPGLPKAPQSNAAPVNSDTIAPSTPVKGTEFIIFGFKIKLMFNLDLSVICCMSTYQSSFDAFLCLGPADASKAFPLQFGSISPGTINVMQVFIIPICKKMPI